jgi:hypothetical protein
MRKKAMDVKYQPFKYHLLAIIRMRLAGIAIPPMSSHKFEKYCEGLVVALQDEKQWVTLFQEAVNILDTVLGGQYARDKAKDVSLLSAAERLCVLSTL